MINGSRQNLKNKKSQVTNEKFVLVRSLPFYGIKIEKYKSEKISLNRGITSTPSFVYHTNNTRCLIDYSNQTNSEMEKKVKVFFEQITNGTTLTIYNGRYKDPNLDEVADLSGNYVFNSFYNGIVEATVTSVSLLSTKVSRYDKTKFEEIPFIIANTVNDQETNKYIIKNRLGKNTKNSFNYLGAMVGDYIKLTNIKNLIKILEMNVDSDGNEYIITDTPLTEQDLTSLKTKIDLYIPVIDSYTVEPDLTETTVGTCVQYFNGTVISCTDNHTNSQCRFRSSAIKEITTEFGPNTFCFTPETDTAVQTNPTDTLVQITSNLSNIITNMNSLSGPVLKNSNSKNGFYGRPF